MTTSSSNNNYIHPLVVGKKEKFAVALEDNLTLEQLAKLSTLVDVVTKPRAALSEYLGSDLMSVYSGEDFDPLSVAIRKPYQPPGNSGVVVDNPISGTITLPPPQNLSIKSFQVDAGTNGQNTISVTVLFDEVSGANGYEIYAVAPSSPATSSVNNVTITSPSSGAIIATWDVLTNAANYVVIATRQSDLAQTTVLVTPTAGATTVSKTLSGLASGSYQVSITPYNSNGYAGQVYNSSIITVA